MLSYYLGVNLCTYCIFIFNFFFSFSIVFQSRESQSWAACSSTENQTPCKQVFHFRAISSTYLLVISFAANNFKMFRFSENLTAEIECARPQTAGEEELQLQLALAMSREEAEQEEQKRRSDDVRLQLALTQSEKEFK